MGQTLPEFMLGEFKMETSEGFEDFLYEIGINWFNRKAELDDWGEMIYLLNNYVFVDSLYCLPYC